VNELASLAGLLGEKRQTIWSRVGAMALQVGTAFIASAVAINQGWLLLWTGPADAMNAIPTRICSPNPLQKGDADPLVKKEHK
jgi:hypothetical protein